MKRAVIAFDVPEDCWTCPLQYDAMSCRHPMGKDIDILNEYAYGGIHKDCPLDFLYRCSHCGVPWDFEEDYIICTQDCEEIKKRIEGEGACKTDKSSE